MSQRELLRDFRYPDFRSRQPARRVIDRVVVSFTDFSDHYPRHLGGVVSGVGMTLVDLLDQSTSPDNVWQGFMGSKLEGRSLANLVRHTLALHVFNGISREADAKVEPIMPIVYKLTKSSLISSVYALTQGDRGEKYEAVEREINPRMTEAVRAFLLEGDTAKANREAILAILTTTSKLLIEKEAVLGKDYLKALMGGISQYFPEARPDDEAITSTRKLLSEHMRELFLPHALLVGKRHGLSPTQVETFIHNITRV